jgi:catechol 2,3-dioxygenase-like lactoylglutathione lyase family enzyme
MRMDGLEQITLTVADVAASVRFYTQTLGLLASNFGPEGTVLHAGSQKLLLRQGELPAEPTQLAFSTRLAMPIITGHLAARGVPLAAGPHRRSDGRESVVVKDPNGHRVEMVSTAGDA